MLLDRLVRAGGAITPAKETGYTVPFDPEMFKLVTYDMLDGSGVKLLLHAFASRPHRRCPTPPAWCSRRSRARS